MRKHYKSNKIEKTFTNIIAFGAIVYIILMLVSGTFLAYLACFITVSIGLILVLIPSYDFTWRAKNYTAKKRLIVNSIARGLIGIFIVGIIYTLIPYSLDFDNFIKKDFSYETGRINRITSTHPTKSHSWRCNVEINNKVIKFERITGNSKNLLENLKSNGSIVKISYLPHTKLGISIKND